MRLGIFAKTFIRPTVEDVFDAVKAHGLTTVQFNMSSAGLPTLPDSIPPFLVTRIRHAITSRNIELAAISGTYNMAHPEPDVRKQGLHRLKILASVCHALNTSVITLCTGSRDPENMWRWHPENSSSSAWSDLLFSLEAALRIAETEQIILAFEPERANIVNSAAQGRKLLTAMSSSHLKVVIDPANLITPAQEHQNDQLLEEAFTLLGDHIIIAHAKDRSTHDDFTAAGEGILNYEKYLQLLRANAFTGPLILHGLSETQVDSALQFLYRKLS